MSVWLTIPSARPPEEATFALWKERGYRIAVFRDAGMPRIPEADITIEDQYPGYALATNRMCQLALAQDPGCTWAVAGGDDTEPDLAHTADEIADQCTAHFGGTFGCMQPTGDRWANGSIDGIAGSPWMGREFCRRLYQGKGPLRPEFWHMFGDQHLQEVATKLGVFWQRRDLIHFHHHWSRMHRGQAPTFLKRANSREHWDEMKAAFEKFRDGGFAEALDLAP